MTRDSYFFFKIIKREISKKGKITLFDADKIKQARKRLKKQYKLQKKSLKQVGKYDIVFCNQVIKYIENDVAFLKGIRNYLKKDGKLILGTPNEGSLPQRFGSYRTKEKSDHVHFYTEKEIKSKIEEANFKIVDTYHEVFYPGWNRLYYRLTSSDFGFKLLELLTILLPFWCSDYYFECEMR